jgi:type VI secretion system secreted protein VgrG
VDIVGAKINLNGGGSPGVPAGTVQPDVLEVLADEDHTSSALIIVEIPEVMIIQHNERKARLRFLLKDDEQKNYSLVDYAIFYRKGKLTGKTDKDGYTEDILFDKPDDIYIDS